MMPDYVTWGGVELANSARAWAYTQIEDECGAAIDMGCLSCPPEDIIDYLTDETGYRGVREDPAPWYDPAIPESARVWGYIGLGVIGPDEGAFADPRARTSADESPAGTVRDVEVSILIEAADDCALSYAMGWLREQLREIGCTAGESSCGGASMCILACCPEGPGDDSALRTMYGLEPIALDFDRDPHQAGKATAVARIVLRTYLTDIWRPTPGMGDISVSLADGTPVTMDLPAVYEACAQAETTCTSDPSGLAPPPPPRPVRQIDPRYPSQPFAALRQVVTIPSGGVPRALRTSPIVTVTSGEGVTLRNVLLRIYSNPLDASCGRLPALNPCRACTDALVSWVPMGGCAVLDPRTRDRLIVCRDDSGTASAPALVWGAAGGAYVDPRIICGTSVCLEIAAASPVPGDAVMHISWWSAQGAA